MPARSRLTATGLLAGAVPSGPALAQSGAKTPRPVKTVVVEAREKQIRRVYPATVLPGREVELSFRVSGQIVELTVRGALRVEKGDLVAPLHTNDFEAEDTRGQRDPGAG